MSERYVKVFGCEDNLYSANAPVIIRAGALLKDTESGRMIAQLKLQNVSEKKISYVKASITMLDAAKNQMGDSFDAEYLDLAVLGFEMFGNKNAVVLPNSSVRAFRVGIKSVAFTDGTVWSGDGAEWFSAPDDSEIVIIVKADDVYKEALKLANSGTEDAVKRAIDLFKSIENCKDVSDDITRCEEKVKEFVEKTEITKKKKKKTTIILISIAGVLVAAALFLFVSWFVVPRVICAYAQTLIEEAKYEEAVETVHDTYYFSFFGVGMTGEMVDEVYYDAIYACVENGDVERAYELHSEHVWTYYYDDLPRYEKITNEQQIQKIIKGIDTVLVRSDFINEENARLNFKFLNFVLNSFESKEYDSVKSIISDYLKNEKINSKHFISSWKYRFVRAYAEEHIEEFLAGRWETADGKKYFSLNSSDSNRIYYNLPIPNKNGVSHYDTDGLLLIFESSSGNKVCDVFKFELNDSDPNVIKIYCYEDNNTYTLYRQ